MATIQASFDAANETSDALDGSKLLGGFQGSHVSSAVGLQVVRGSGTGSFEVRFEAGIPRSDGAVTYDTVATITQAEVNDPITLTIAPGMRYRFRCESIGSSTSVIALAS